MRKLKPRARKLKFRNDHHMYQNCIPAASDASPDHSRLASATMGTLGTEGLWPDGLATPANMEMLWTHFSGGVAASVWSSSPSKPPTGSPACDRCLTKMFRYRT